MKNLPHLVEGNRDAPGQRLDFRRWRQDVGHHDDLETRRLGGLNSGVRILERKARGGVNAKAPDGFEVNVGSRLAVGDFISGDQNGEVAEEVRLLQAEARGGITGGGGDGERDPSRREVTKQLVNAGFERKPVLTQVIVVEDVAGAARGLVVKLAPESGAKKRRGIAIPAADEGSKKSIGHVMSRGPRGLLPGDPGDALGVEHQTIHVKDDAGASRERSEVTHGSKKPSSKRFRAVELERGGGRAAFKVNGLLERLGKTGMPGFDLVIAIEQTTRGGVGNLELPSLIGHREER